MVDSNNQEMKMIVSLSVIINYIHYYHPNLTKFHQDTRSCVFVNVAYLTKVFIRHYYHGAIIIFKAQVSQPKYSKQKVWRKSNPIYETYKNTFMPHVRHIYAISYDTGEATMCANSKTLLHIILVPNPYF